MQRLDENRLRQLMEWLEEAPEATNQEVEDELQAKKAAERNARMGHKRHTPYDYSGPTPEENPVKSDISPKLAGDRAKAIMVMGRVEGFIEKYSNFAVDKFRGASATPEKSIGLKGSGLGVHKGMPTKGAGDRELKGGGVASMQQMMSKDKVMQLINKLPMMPSSQMMFAVRAIGNYVWKIHANVRDDIRKSVKDRLGKQAGGKVSSSDPGYDPAIKAASREFETDSVNIKADLNMLASVAGVLKRSGGFGGKADMTFLDKIIQGYTDDSGQYHIKGTKIAPKPSDVALPPELAKMASSPEGEEDEDERPAKSSKKSSEKPKASAKGPTIRKAAPSMKSDISDDEADEEMHALGISDSIVRPFDRFIDEMIEIAATDVKPKWWDEL